MNQQPVTTPISWLESILLTLTRLYVSYYSRNPWRIKQQRQWWLVVVGLSVSCAAVIQALLQPLLIETNLLLLFIIPVLVSAWYGGFKAGGIATVTSVIVSNFFSPTAPGQLILSLPTVVFAVVGLMISVLNEILQRVTDRTVRTLDTIIDGCIAVNAHWQVQYINEAGQKFLKKTWQELQGQPLTAVLEEAHHRRFYQRCRTALHEHRPQKFEEFYPELKKWFEVSIYPSIEGLTIYLSDITRYKVIEQEQERSHELLTAVIEGTSDAVYVKDLAGRYLLINEAGARLLGRTAAEVIDRKDSELFTADTAKKIKAGEDKVIKSGQQLTYEDVGTAAGQTRTYLSSKGPLRDQRGEIIGIVGISSDITERKKFEQRKDEFISIASHELKTPLTSLRLFISILEKALAEYPDTAVKDYVIKIKLQTNRLTRLVGDLLDISKIRAGKLEFRTTTFNLNEVLAEIVEVMQATSQRHHITITGHLSRPLTGDPERIGQVFINLLSNAIKYSPQATKIEVTVSESNQQAVISVRDFGVGIDPTVQAKIFDRFYQVADAENPAQPGLGMGLYIAHEIVRRHSGSIAVESQSGVGSTFVVKLPLAYAHAEASHQSAHRG